MEQLSNFFQKFQIKKWAICFKKADHVFALKFTNLCNNVLNATLFLKRFSLKDGRSILCF